MTIAISSIIVIGNNLFIIFVFSSWVQIYKKYLIL